MTATRRFILRLRYGRRIKGALYWAQHYLGIKQAGFTDAWEIEENGHPLYYACCWTPVERDTQPWITLYTMPPRLQSVFHECVHIRQYERRAAMDSGVNAMHAITGGTHDRAVYNAQPIEVEAVTVSELMVERAPAWLVRMWEQ